MPTTAEMLLSELEEAGDALMQGGEHDGACTNENQMKIYKIPQCAKHASAFQARKRRFKEALDQFKLMHDVFGPLNGV